MTPQERTKIKIVFNSHSTHSSPRKRWNKPLRSPTWKMWYLLWTIWISSNLIKVQFSQADMTNNRLLPHRTKWTISPSTISSLRPSSQPWLSNSFTPRSNTPVEWAATNTPLATQDTLLAVKTMCAMYPPRKSHLNQEKTSTSLMVAGSAANARTTTSRVEKSVSDARRVKTKKIRRESPNTCSKSSRKPPTPKKVKRTLDQRTTKRKPSPKTSTMRTPTSLLISNSPRRELVIGLVKGASTTTSPSEKCATSANAHKARATRWFSRNNKISPTCSKCIINNRQTVLWSHRTPGKTEE